MGGSLSGGTGLSPRMHGYDGPSVWGKGKRSTESMRGSSGGEGKESSSPSGRKKSGFKRGEERNADTKTESKMGDVTNGERRWGNDDSDEEELSISFEYQFGQNGAHSKDTSGEKNKWEREEDMEECPTIVLPVNEYNKGNSWKRQSRSSSFSGLSVAAMCANATLANTTLNNNTIGGIVLPGLDSPRNFRSMNSFLPSSVSSSGSSYGVSMSQDPSSASSSTSPPAIAPHQWKLSLSAPTPMESSFLMESCNLKMAGGPAGEDRVQAICSEEDGWLYCAVYDGFNGRDAADYLAANLYGCVMRNLRLLAGEEERREELEREWSLDGSGRNRTCYSRGQEKLSLGARGKASEEWSEYAGRENFPSSSVLEEDAERMRLGEDRKTSGSGWKDSVEECEEKMEVEEDMMEGEAFRQAVLAGLKKSISQTETEFLDMVEQEMEERPDLAMVGSCVLATLLQGQDLYTINLGDSRAVLATNRMPPFSSDAVAVETENEKLYALQLTESHTVDSQPEKLRLLLEHPDDASPVVGLRVKGKLRVTRAFGAGYLKDTKFNDALLGIMRVRDLESPPYVSSSPHVSARRVCKEDRFVVIGSDGLFDFFSNEEVVSHVWRFISEHPGDDPAKYILEQLLIRAAQHGGLTLDELKAVPLGRRRKYHDDVTILIVTFGNRFHTSSASTLVL